MTTHIKAFTYEPKIPDVLTGNCRQTIRPYGKRPVIEGDQILFHGWSGIPYRSKWNWRLRVIVTESPMIFLYSDGILFEPFFLLSRITEWKDLSELAREDGIRAENGMNEGETMGSHFNKMYPGLSMFNEGLGTPFQIIRW